MRISPAGPAGCWAALLAFSVCSVGAVADAQDTESDTPAAILDMLQKWEHGSKSFSPITDLQKQQFVAEQEGQLNGHEMDVVHLFRGPVTQQSLVERFRWTDIESDDKSIKLSGVPREAGDQLFCDGFVIEFDPKTSWPISIEFPRIKSDGPTSLVNIDTRLMSEDPTIIAPPIRDSEVQLASRSTTGTESLVETADGVNAATDRLQPPRRVPPLGENAKVEDIIKAWTSTYGNIEQYEVRFQRFVYDQTTLTEMRSTGTAFYAGPNRAEIVLKPMEVKPDELSRKVDPKSGEKFKLLVDRAETWTWSNGELRMTDAEGNFEKFPTNPSLSGREAWGFGQFLPLATRESLSEIDTNFEVKLASLERGRIHLKIRPRTPALAIHYRELQVMLDPQTMLVAAVKVVEPSGRQETVYVFSDYRVLTTP